MSERTERTEIERYAMQLVDHWPQDPEKEAWTELREQPHPQGHYVKYEDHLVALGEIRSLINDGIEANFAERERAETAERELPGLRERMDALLAAIKHAKNAIGHMDQDMSELCFDRLEMQRFNALYKLAETTEAALLDTESSEEGT